MNLNASVKGIPAAAMNAHFVSDIQAHAREAGLGSVYVTIDAFGHDAQLLEVAPLTRVTPSKFMGTTSAVADAIYGVEYEVRRRNLIIEDQTRWAVLSDGIAFGTEADPEIVAAAFAWISHPVCALVEFEVYLASLQAWGDEEIRPGVSVAAWLERWADKPMANGFRPRFLHPKTAAQLAAAELRGARAA